MHLHSGKSPNGFRVEIFCSEKGVNIPMTNINVAQREAQTEEFLALNSLGEVPVLVLDDGTVLTESIAICRYIESLHSEPALFGVDPHSQALIEMWNRRMELKLFNAIGDVARHEFKFFSDRGQIPEFAKMRREDFARNLRWLDNELIDERPFIAGSTFSVADITGMAMLALVGFAEYEIPDDCGYVKEWAGRMMSRDSWPM